jgi:hypothetical protein
MTIVPRRYFPARMIGCVAGQGSVRVPPCSQIEQARYLIERKRQLAHHDDKRNREEVKAVIHRRVTKIRRRLTRKQNLLLTTMIRQHDSALNRRQSDSLISLFG